MAGAFSTAVDEFKAAKVRHWRPSTKVVTYGALAAVGVGGIAASAVMGTPILTVASALSAYRAGNQAWKAWKESKKVRYEKLGNSTGTQVTGMWKSLGTDAARGLEDTELVKYHSGANEAITRANKAREMPGLVDTSGWSATRFAGFERIIQLAENATPEDAQEFLTGVREELESRRLAPRSVAQSAAPAGGLLVAGTGVVGPAGGGGRVEELRRKLHVLSADVEATRSRLANARTVVADFQDQFENELGSSSSGRDVLEMLSAASAAVEEAQGRIRGVVAGVHAYAEDLVK